VAFDALPLFEAFSHWRIVYPCNEGTFASAFSQSLTASVDRDSMLEMIVSLRSNFKVIFHTLGSNERIPSCTRHFANNSSSLVSHCHAQNLLLDRILCFSFGTYVVILKICFEYKSTYGCEGSISWILEHPSISQIRQAGARVRFSRHCPLIHISISFNEMRIAIS
jgi:hypothetical protein